MPRETTAYVIGFAAAVCGVCSILVSSAAVALKPAQEANKLLDKQKKVLIVAGLMEEGAKLSPEEIEGIFQERIDARIVDMSKDAHDTSFESDATRVGAYDSRKAAKDPALSFEVGDNAAKVKRVPNHTVVYHVKNEAGAVEQYVLPISGPGLWSTLHGFLAVGTDGVTIEGITFYEHAETPGLGGEVDNPSWKALWPGRKIGDEPGGEVKIEVIKGQAGTVAEDPYKVDGLSGATITSRGVSYTLEFWMGDEGFGPYLKTLASGA